MSSHVGWIFSRRNDATDWVKVTDFARYPELLWLHKYELVPPAVLAILSFLIGGWPGLIVGFFWSTVLVYHATFCINSLAHVRGRRRFVTGDDSRNNWLLALVTMGGAGTTITTPIRAASARVFAGGRSTRHSTSSTCCR